MQALAWHVRCILIKQESAFHHYHAQIGSPAAIQSLTVEKIRQYPANAIHVDKRTLDGNWQVLTNHLNQGGILEDVLEDNVDLVHGNLATKERIDGLRLTQKIKKTANCHLDYVVFVPGLFHFKMVYTDAYWHAHISPQAGEVSEMYN
jgi:hypothetical protein